jgi:hypothetical protein
MPTKQLFISMLTRDIGLIPSIIDLVDNAADGARQLRADGGLAGLWVRVEASERSFKISDNCGGISVETARNYAFRFGRAAGAPAVRHSVGQFGVGMKRAIFKLGSRCRVESATKTSSFVVNLDVAKWATSKEWEFEFSDVVEATTIAADKRGTRIHITSLHADVASKLALQSFENELARELERRLQEPISRGLAVSMNGLPVAARPLLMLADKRLVPAAKVLKFKAPKQKVVRVKLFCGLGPSDRALAGWHVFCNGRLVLEADKTIVTGWGEKARGLEIAGFHNQYTHLRGFAYFDSDDPGLLPWNTTKTGLDTDSAVYRATRLEMIRLMQPVVRFLNQVKVERQDLGPDSSGHLQEMLAASKTVAVDDVQHRPVFTVRYTPITIRRPSVQRLQYDVPLDKAEQVKKVLKVSSWKALGERTFDYFYDNEVAE